MSACACIYGIQDPRCCAHRMHFPVYGNTPKPEPVNRPWECPKCGTVHAWWVASCRCSKLPINRLSPLGGGPRP